MTKGAAGFCEPVVHIFGDKSIAGDDTTKVHEQLHSVEWVAVNSDLRWTVYSMRGLLVNDFHLL